MTFPASQIVPALADQGVFIASESSFYRVLHEKGQQQHREKVTPAGGRNQKDLQQLVPIKYGHGEITYLAHL